MSSRFVLKAMTGFYLLLFFTYLFGPLAIMGITAFNTPSYPQAYPFEGFTWHWFSVLAADKDVLYGLQKSIQIGVFVVLLSVPLGLAGALVMQQIYARARSLYYLVVVSPVLTPGVIIGISTVIFWRDLTTRTGTRFFYDGTVLTVLGQSSYIAAYAMLIILARLQRFDRGLEEAALDLGASHTQVFFHVKLAFLRGAGLSQQLRELQHHHLLHPGGQDADHRAGRARAPGHLAGAVGSGGVDHRGDGAGGGDLRGAETPRGPPPGRRPAPGETGGRTGTRRGVNTCAGCRSAENCR
jgi:ABC-type spermidine/putrescine transport system permease subunit II